MGDKIISIKTQLLETKQVINNILNNDEELNNIKQIAYQCYKALLTDNKIMLIGNGGSAADAQHIAGEYVSRFNFDRNPLPAIALTTDTSILTAIGNDYGYEHVFSRQVEAWGSQNDVLMAYSTSGNSKNIIKALESARKKGITTIGFTGDNNGIMNDYCDYIIKIPSTQTPRIQEGHAIIGHIICGLVEELIFKNKHEPIPAIILAGGYGTRLQELNLNVPKPMAPINGEPFLEILLDKIFLYDDVEEVCIATGYKGYVIEEYFDHQYLNKSIYYSEELNPLGTGGAIVEAISYIGDEDLYYVMNGDSYIDVQLSDIIEAQKESDKSIIVTTHVDDISRYGGITLDDQNNIVSFIEKGNSGPGLINTGVYLIKGDIFDNFNETIFSFEQFIADHKDLFKCIVVEGDFIDIGIPEDYYRAQEFFK